MPRETRPTTYIFFGVLFAAVTFISHAGLLSMPPVWDEAGLPWLSMPPAWAVRSAMLALASLTLLGTFLVAVELCGSLPGLPALFAVAMLAASPMFYMQSALVLPAVPATLCGVFGLWFALRRRWLAAGICAAALLAVLAVGWPYFHFYLLPLPGVRLRLVTLARRLFVLLVSDGHLLASAGMGLALFRGTIRGRRWTIAGAFCLAWFLLCLFMRPQTDRELLPIFPVLYVGAVAGFHTLPSGPRLLACTALILSLVAGLFWHPLNLPFPFENTLALADTANLQQMTALYLERNAVGKVILAEWPLSQTLRQPELGSGRAPDVYVRCSTFWDGQPSPLRSIHVRQAAQRYLGLRFPESTEGVEKRLGLRLAATFVKSGQWVEVYSK